MNEFLCQVCADERATVVVAADFNYDAPMRLADLCSDCWEIVDKCMEHIRAGRYSVMGDRIVLGKRVDDE